MVQDLHDAGVAHRDVKPGNLLVDRTRRLDRVLVTDLGTAKLLADASGITATAGTPAYMAPEQVHGDDGIDERADVYAIGVVAYELLSGRRPFVVPDLRAVIDRRDERPQPIASDLGLPAAVDAVLGAALVRDRTRRPKDARTMGDLLIRAGEGEVDLMGQASTWSGWTVLLLCLLVGAIAAGATWLLLS